MPLVTVEAPVRPSERLGVRWLGGPLSALSGPLDAGGSVPVTPVFWVPVTPAFWCPVRRGFGFGVEFSFLGEPRRMPPRLAMPGLAMTSR